MALRASIQRSGRCRRSADAGVLVRCRVNRRDIGDTKRMAPRPLTEAAVLKQLKTVGEKLAGTVSGEKRLALLRRQADLGDQRDEAADKARKAK